ncbi:BglG family transcription antiterminator [Paenibacillus doosanensis]|uniref:LicABCH operon regulator n=1 Tax=Paenibacillus konkukensis TaxID=2020716 RepID=A0ABY4RUF9_9BACL|nr:MULTISPECIES: BglG family transcription antiterminator [Paenibacillus]MCS7460297.1 BglG family transcription antiterminator [Paenibacillus doosanensis]UQZ86157.1 putative licABCH operon regulator [Paenibacillus konkukensis]
MLTLLLDAADYVSLEELMQKLGISRRTVYYDMDKINGWLKAIHLPPVEYVRTAGYYLPDESRSGIPQLAEGGGAQPYYLSPRERLAWLALQLLSAEEPLFVHHLTDLLQVSRGTVLKDLNIVRPELEDWKLRLTYDRKQGYRVQGDESDKRKALNGYFGHIAGGPGWERAFHRKHEPGEPDLTEALFPPMKEEQLKQVYRLIADSAMAMGADLTDEMIFNLTTRFLLYTRRIQEARFISIDEDERGVLRKMPEFAAAARIAEELGRMFGVSFPGEEVCYLTMHLLGARVNRVEQMTGSAEVIQRLREAAKQMVDDFQRHACVFLPNRETMEDNLLVHLKPAYYRILYGLELENPLLDNIRSKYGEVFEITRRSAAPFERMVGRKLNDNEIGYLAMHFGGWLRRENTQPAARKRAAIVCVNGISASRMLKIQLDHLFSAVDITAVLSLREYESFNEESVDFIFSTVPLPGSKAPVFVVNPILSDKDKEHLLNRINTVAGLKSRTQASTVQALLDIVRKHAEVHNEQGLAEELNRYLSAGKTWLSEARKPSLTDLLTEPMIRVKKEAADWRSAIREAAEPLLSDGRIDEAYIEAMIAKVEALGPYIVVAPGIAIAHAKPQDGVKKLGISLLRLAKPVAFSEEARHQVQIILVLAAIDGESHLKALSELTLLLREQESLTRLKEASTKKQILQLLHAGPYTR